MQTDYALPMQQEQAEIIALQALTYLATHEDHMGKFAALSGMGADDMMHRANDPEMLAGVMDFFLSDENLLTEFCATCDIAPDLPAQARQLLPGGALPHWT